MTKTAKITSKGQITVPNEVRRALGVGPGDRLVFRQNGSGFEVKALRGESPFERYRGIGMPEVGKGREAVLRAVREIRGE